MDIGKYIIDHALIIVPALWIIGALLKQTPVIKDWLIPWILLACGVAGAIAIMGFNAEAVIQGILVAGMSVYGNQLVKQSIKRN